ncbi:MAG: lanthionine synthetase C family protein [Saonia sp.]
MMKHEPLLHQKLKKISDILQDKYKEVEDVGVLAGISGIALFQFYYSKYLDVDEHADFGTEMISHCIDKINSGYSFPTYCTGIAGLGWTIQHLNAKNFVDIDCDGLLSPFDEYLYNQMKFDLTQGNYDFLHGAIGYGFHFLSRFTNTVDPHLKSKYQFYLLELIHTLDTLAISEGNTLKWESTLNIEKGISGYNLSLSHGMSSILNFLSRLQKFGVFKESTQQLVRGTANYILSFENKRTDQLSLFPSWVENGIQLQYKSRIAWCYGDLGIGISLMQAGKSLGDSAIQQRAQKILDHTANRKTQEETMVNDAGICHGSYGNALVYNRISQEANMETFKEILDFWIDDGIQKAIYEDGYAGYKQWNGLEKNFVPELSLLEGIAGIGLVIIDYLSETPNTWDECLMIS